MVKIIRKTTEIMIPKARMMVASGGDGAVTGRGPGWVASGVLQYCTALPGWL